MYAVAAACARATHTRASRRALRVWDPLSKPGIVVVYKTCSQLKTDPNHVCCVWGGTCRLLARHTALHVLPVRHPPLEPASVSVLDPFACRGVQAHVTTTLSLGRSHCTRIEGILRVYIRNK